MDSTARTVRQERRPHPNLFLYYCLESLLLGPFFFLALIPRTFRYLTLHYYWDERGITARWGKIFRREISLDFERIQDIHLSSNLVERWLGLAKVQVQTASGSSRAEMTVEGLQDYAEVRDYLYSRMRGVSETETEERGAGDTGTAEVVQALRATAAELRALRKELATRRGQGFEVDGPDERDRGDKAP